MTFRGRVQNGVIVMEAPVLLPEGTVVRFEPVVEAQQAAPPQDDPPAWAGVFREVMGKAEGLLSDLARNHDHYLHNAPKR